MQAKPNGAAVSKAVINRLPRYYRYLKELLSQNILRISSGELAGLMNVTASQIRQDLNCFGGFGQQGYGYNVKYLYGKIGEILGAEEAYSAVIIGAGNLGHALAQGSTFASRGVFLKAIFDHNPSLIGRKVGDFEIQDSAYLADYCKENRVDIAVLTVPKSAAAAVATHLKGLSIKGIWNFTGEELNIEEAIPVQNVHLGDLLMTLCYEIHTGELAAGGHMADAKVQADGAPEGSDGAAPNGQMSDQAEEPSGQTEKLSDRTEKASDRTEKASDRTEKASDRTEEAK